MSRYQSESESGPESEICERELFKTLRSAKLNGRALYFVGIGGIGMSGVAEVLHKTGFRVHGSDKTENSNTSRLCHLGIRINIGHDASNVTKDKTACLVISEAIKCNPECERAQELGIPIFHRAEALAFIMSSYNNSVTVSGTHGKTTTTSLVAALLEAAAFQPTVINGGIMNAFGSNAHLGSKNDWIVAEGDESDGSFKNLPSSISIVTNIEPEHMEYFGNEENIEREFQHFIEKATRTRILCVDCPRVRKMADNILNRNKITCGFHNSADIRCVNVKYTENGSYYDVIDGKSGDALMGSLHLPLHGQHNVQNALVLVALARELNISDETLREALKTFTGVERRFTITGKVNGITVVDDYAHHPSEIEAVLKAARKITFGKLFAVLQPHRYSRLSRLFPQFSTCFGQSADQVLLLPVYSAGETNTLGVSSEILAASITPTTTTKVFHFQTVEAASKHLCEVCLPQDMIVFMGAGDITYLANDFPEISKKYYAEKSCVEKQ